MTQRLAIPGLVGMLVLLCVRPAALVEDPEAAALRRLGQGLLHQAVVAYDPPVAQGSKGVEVTLEERGAEEPERVMELLALQPGMTAVDLGCGCGFYTLPMAREVGSEGRVVAVELNPDGLACVRARVEAGECPGCGPIRTVLGEPEDPKLDEGSVDLVLMANLDFYAFEEMLPVNRQLISAVHPARRPRGGGGGLPAKPPVHGAEARFVYRNFQTAGFDAIRAHYFLIPGEADQVQGLRFGRVPGSTSVLYEFRRPEQATLDAAGRMLSTVPFTSSVTENPIGIGRQ